jgi:hypothetical protein
MGIVRKTVEPRTENHTQQRMLDRDDAQTRQMRDVELLEGRSYKDITIVAAGTYRVGHGLGHVPRGYIVTSARNPGAGTLYLSASDAESITFGNSGGANITVTVWVY